MSAQPSASHAPPGYDCPFCRLGKPAADPRPGVLDSDLIAQDELTAVFIGTRQWPANPGNTLVIPRAHHENLYAMPPDLLGPLHAAAQRVALALKQATGCAGVSLRQHNEPAGSQDVWHYHVHVTPRFVGDNFYRDITRAGYEMPPVERARLADALRAAFSSLAP